MATMTETARRGLTLALLLIGSAALAAAPAHKASPYAPEGLPPHAQNYYRLFAGVDKLKVRRTASGNLIRFSYLVTDPARAKALGDKQVKPVLYGMSSHALLQIPEMDNIGQLRQVGTPEAGQEYWMVFSNKGNLVKAGERVNVLVGSLHIDGLVVE